MQYYVNGRLVEAQPDSGLSVEAGIRTVGAALYQQNQLIIKVEADGRDVTGMSFEDWAEGELPARLDLSTESPLELLASSVNVSREWLGPLGMELRNCADRFRLGEEAQAIDSLLRVIDGLRLLMAGIAQIERLYQSLHRDTDISQLTEFQEELTGLLDQIIDAQESRDWILLADVLEYDIAECPDGWNHISAHLLDSLA